MRRIILYLSLQLGAIFLAHGQEKAIHYKELQKHLPSKLMGFVSEGEATGNMFEMNDLSYSSASREYTQGDSYLTVTLVDYKSASSMYQASTMAWAGGMSYEDDEQKASSVTINGMQGWLSYNKIDREAQLILGYKDRYLITILHSDASDEESVKAIVDELNLNDLP